MGNLVKFGCKECGSPHVREKDGKLHCISCDTWFEKNVETDEERDARVLYLTRLDRAEELLSMSPPRFDDAEDHFRKFIDDYPDQSDGYWGLVRARYGIKYENDPNGNKVPSCYKSSYEDFRRDSDFMKALSRAKNDYIYDNLQEQAKLIASVCKEWREETKKYNYDIFISFKDEDKSLGISDEDRNEMNGLYDFLKDQGYSVFFSPRSMCRYTGKHSDAYIFNALQKAKVMIVYGSKPEYFTMTWVQNEWTRFLRMVANGKKKKGSCIVVYNGFNPNMLPHDLYKLQAVDASQKRYYIDILNRVKDVLAEEKKVDTNEELMRKIEELKRQNEESQKRQEELQKSLEEEKKKNTVKQVEQKPTATSDSKKETPKTQKKSTDSKPAQPATTKPSATAEAKSKENENINVDPDFEIVKGTLVKYSGNKTYVVIPDNVNSIGILAFKSCKSLTSVVIPDNVKFIGDEAFKNCSSLKSVTIPDSVTSIGDEAFRSCSNLKSVTIPNSVTSIGDHAFYNCKSLKSVTIPDSVTEIGESAFSGCFSLKSVTIPNSVTSIGYNTFKECSNLESVTIPDSVTSIGDRAFSSCDSLTSVTIPDSVTEIGAWAFAGCKSLTIWVNDQEQINKWKFGWNSDNRPVRVIEKETTTEEQTKKTTSDKPMQPSVTVPNATSQNLTAKPSTTATAKPQESKKSEVDPDFEIVDGCLIKYKGRKKNIVIPNGVTSIGEYAFNYCSSLTSVTISDSVTSIGGSAFSYCFSLKSVTIPDSVISIGYDAFKGTAYYNDESNWINGVLYIGNHLIDVKDTISGECVIKHGTITIADYAFYGCSSLKSITVDKNNTRYKSINGNLYSKDGKTFIQYAEGKTDASFKIPDSVEVIGEYAFRDCSNLSSVVIPTSVTFIGKSAFKCCSNLNQMIVDENNQYYKSIEGNLYTIDGKTLVQYAIGKKDTSLKILDSVEVIGDSAFSRCNNLTSILIPDSVTSIGDEAFSGCFRLTSVTISDSVTSIGNWAFSGCFRLTSVTITDNFTSIGNWAFLGYSSLTSMTIPDSITSIGDGAFSHCSSLTSVTIPDSVTSIGNEAFCSCSSLKSVTIPDSVASIGYNTFKDCSSLKGVTFNDPKGWYVTGIRTPLLFLSNTSISAKYLTSKYVECKWSKKK